MTIDVWVQHPTERFLRLEIFAGMRSWPSRTPTLGETIAAMDTAGVAFGLVNAFHGPEGAAITNDEVAGFVAAHPDRLAGLAAVNLRDPMGAVRELRRCVTELGFKGLRALPWLWELPPTDRRYYPLFAACVDLGVPFCTQVGYTGVRRTSETGRPIPYIDDIANDFPELVVVAGHIGYPWTQEMIAVARKHANVYIDVSAYPAHRYPAELVSYLQGASRHKVLFATNYPMILPRTALAGLDALSLSDDAREAFLTTNARRVFNL